MNRIVSDDTSVHSIEMKSANGVVILVLGILAWFGFGPLTGVIAWILGNGALRDIDAGLADPSERQMVQIGRILGMINTILSAIFICLMVLFFAGMLGFMGFAASQSGGPNIK